ncbi:hypothetical protein [Acinetobacter venetianus]|uniref:hypothetical protein n=1 Tax=Acinetobacter venetianus TaxID=52133 RepID=UPI00214FF608|nr:hypothetical protein [Acinetobacter venetianus]MCR4532489.1 hypothetical protein [Acinetobacter venetianus]
MDNSIFLNVHSLNPSKPKEKIIAQLNAWMKDENTCHYFAIQIAGSEIHPFGIIDRPFYDIEKANLKLEDLKNKNPNADYYISYGAFDTDVLNFNNDDTPMWEKVWLNKHEYRLLSLKVKRMSRDELVKVLPNYDAIMNWQEAQNTKDLCHCYFATSFDDKERDIPTSSSFAFDLLDALIAKLYFEKTMPDRNFRIQCHVLSTAGMLSVDGKTADFFQDLIDAHKDRIAHL